ncbi:flagellar biosynthetic protein FliO [Ammoniphilus sp. 3BR4]|uniref:flagellar biosynthetic protein FliO n=1 Tax=Ammoniphilus sp. 3BR4 TaxID=3158265 RepID=UPI003467998B
MFFLSRLCFTILAMTNLFVFLGPFLPQGVLAVSEQPSVETKLGEEINKGQIGAVGSDFEVLPYLLKVVFFLIIIGLLIYFLIRFLSNQSRQSMGGLPLRLLGGIALGHNRSVQVVQVGGKVYLLGVGQDVHLLHMMEDEEEVAEWLAKQGETPRLLDALNKWKKRKAEDTSFEYVFEEQLNQLKANRSFAEQNFEYPSDPKEGKEHDI